jgi:hypothetical protein
MTGDESRTLRVGDRVCWGATTTDLGTVIRTSWSEVIITWDGAVGISGPDLAHLKVGDRFREKPIHPGPMAMGP